MLKLSDIYLTPTECRLLFVAFLFLAAFGIVVLVFATSDLVMLLFEQHQAGIILIWLGILLVGVGAAMIVTAMYHLARLIWDQLP